VRFEGSGGIGVVMGDKGLLWGNFEAFDKSSRRDGGLR
jgi:hypothetical protein